MQTKVVTLLFVSVLMGVLLAPGLVFAAGYANSDLLIETAQLEKMLNDPGVRVVDARPNGEYKKGHIPGAVNLSYQEIDDPKGQVENELLPTETLATMLGDRGIGKDTKVVFYDASGGFRAARLFWMMEYLGHRKVAILNGGYPKWVKEGRNVTKKAPTVEKARFPMSVTPRKLATADWLVVEENPIFYERLRGKFGAFFIETDIRETWAGCDFKFMADETELARLTKDWSGFHIGKKASSNLGTSVLEIANCVASDNEVRRLILAAVMCIDLVRPPLILTWS